MNKKCFSVQNFLFLIIRKPSSFPVRRNSKSVLDWYNHFDFYRIQTNKHHNKQSMCRCLRSRFLLHSTFSHFVLKSWSNMTQPPSPRPQLLGRENLGRIWHNPPSPPNSWGRGEIRILSNKLFLWSGSDIVNTRTQQQDTH